MTKRVCLGIQSQWGDSNKFNLILVRDQAFTEVEELWAVYTYSKIHHSVPEMWSRFVWDTAQAWSDIVYVPAERVVEYETSSYVLGEGNPYPAMVIEAYRLHKAETQKVKRMVSLYVRDKMVEKYGDVADNLPELDYFQDDNQRLLTLIRLMHELS